MNRYFFFVLCFGLLLSTAACGQSRGAEDTLAGGEEPVAAGDDAELEAEEPDDGVTTPPETVPSTPPTSAPDDETALTAVFTDETLEIQHGDLNRLVFDSLDNETFVADLLGGQVPPGFASSVLGEMLVSEALGLEIAEFDGEATSGDVEQAKADLVERLSTTILSTQDDPEGAAEELMEEVPYLSFLAEFDASRALVSDLALERAAAEAEPGELVGTPCVRHILVETEDEADAALARLDDGEEFADVAVELSIDQGSGAQGGELGCRSLTDYVEPFAEAVEAAELNEVVGPVESDFGFHIIEVTDYDGAALAIEGLRDRLSSAEIEVDERLGEWDPVQLVIVPAQS